MRGAIPITGLHAIRIGGIEHACFTFLQGPSMRPGTMARPDATVLLAKEQASTLTGGPVAYLIHESRVGPGIDKALQDPAPPQRCTELSQVLAPKMIQGSFARRKASIAIGIVERAPVPEILVAYFLDVQLYAWVRLQALEGFVPAGAFAEDGRNRRAMPRHLHLGHGARGVEKFVLCVGGIAGHGNGNYCLYDRLAHPVVHALGPEFTRRNLGGIHGDPYTVFWVGTLDDDLRRLARHARVEDVNVPCLGGIAQIRPKDQHKRGGCSVFHVAVTDARWCVNV